MDIVKIVVFALVAVILSMIVKSTRPENSLIIEIAAGVIILAVVIGKIASLCMTIENFARKINFNSMYLGILLKVIGIAYIAEFGIGFCKDAGRSAIASKIELGARIAIIVVALPVMSSLIKILSEVLR